MMKVVFLLPQTIVPPAFVQQKLPSPAPASWPQQVIKSPEIAKFYPNHSSLEEEIHRLLISDSRALNANWGSKYNCKYILYFYIFHDRVSFKESLFQFFIH